MQSRTIWRASSALLLVMTASGAAFAQCTPDPVPANGTTTCTGVDADGLVVATSGATVAIEAGASVANLLVTKIVQPGDIYPSANFATVNAQGAVTGGLVLSAGTLAPGAAPLSGPSTLLDLTVGSGGSISGGTAITLLAPLSTVGFYSATTLVLTNGGTISSTSGAAITGDRAQRIGVDRLDNLTTGVIGAIDVPVSVLSNAGTIDGGALSAVHYGVANASYPYSLTNSGTIRSGSASATIRMSAPYSPIPSITNSGVISNSGSGDAIGDEPVSSRTLSVSNADGGSIAATSGRAIAGGSNVSLVNNGLVQGASVAVSANGFLSVVNRGRIVGDVVSNLTPGTYSFPTFSVVDNAGGIIDGSLRLGSSDDRVVVSVAEGAGLLSSITGTVDAGSGSDMLQLHFATDSVLASMPSLPATFEALSMSIASGATLTLAPGFAKGAGALWIVPENGYYGGGGTLVNKADMSFAGPFLRVDPGTTLSLRNEASITATATLPDAYVISLPFYGRFANSGTITANGGNGVTVQSFDPVVNTGTIVADGTALDIFNGVLDNSGTITSRLGNAVQLSGNVGTPARNSGIIQGRTAGAAVSGMRLMNSGTISASGGSGVALSAYGSLDNLAGGVVNGGVGPSDLYGWTFQSGVRNAGTINGTVNLGSSFGSYYGSGNTVELLPGGIINGDLVLGSGGDTLVTSLAGTDGTRFAGLTGSVSGGGSSNLRLIVTGTASASTLAPGGLFGSIGYDLWNDAALTLTAPAPSSIPLAFSGTGRIDLTADISGGTEGNALVDLTATSYRRVEDSGLPVANALELTSRGRLTTIHGSPFSAAVPAVRLGAGDSLVNKGEIVALELAPNPYYGDSALVAIQGGRAIVNDGLIAVGGGATAISGWFSWGGPSGSRVTNNGQIRQIDGTAMSVGLFGNLAITNNGAITTGDSAVAFSGLLSGSRLVNNGLIASSAAIAVRGGQASVVNAAGGTISGGAGFAAVALAPGSLLDNAGTIAGDVRLGDVSAGYSYGGSSYIGRGGTIAGNLSLTSGDDVVVLLGESTGVSGTIDAGAGYDRFIRQFQADATVALGASAILPDTFEAIGFSVADRNVTVTLEGPASGFAGNLTLLGEGTFVNRATIANGTPTSPYFVRDSIVINPADVLASASSGARFINEGRIADRVSGVVRSFVNSGTIGGGALYTPAAALTLGGVEPFEFANSGRIELRPGLPWSPYLPMAVQIGDVSAPADRASARLANSGTVLGGLGASVGALELRFDNSGSLSAYSVSGLAGNALVLNQTTDPAALAGTFTVANSGTIVGDVQLGSNAQKAIVVNSGSINGATSINAVNSGFKMLPAGMGSIYVQTFDPLTQLTVTNAGTMTASGGDSALALASSARTISVNNSGSLTTSAVAASTPYVPLWASSALFSAAYVDASMAMTIANSGTVTNLAIGGSGIVAAADVGLDLSSYASLAPSVVAAPANAVMSLTNTGSVRANGGAFLSLVSPCCTWLPGPPVPTITLVTGVGVFGSATGTESITITNAAGGLIEAGGALRMDSDPPSGPSTGPWSPPVAAGVAPGFGSIAMTALGDSVRIVNAGTITGGPGGTFGSSTQLVLDALSAAGGSVAVTDLFPDRYLAGAIQTFLSADRLENSGTINGSIDLGAGNDVIVNTGLIAGNVFLRAGNDSVTNSGRITGALDLGAGDDLFVLRSGSTNAGVTGGAGTDGLTLQLSGTATAPDGIDLGAFSAFERLRHESGAALVSGTFSASQIDVLAGRLTGAPGSVLSATTFSVAAGATFGSAGTVNGNIVSQGLLAPGASPGTMTVNGNVTLAPGSAMLFELSPAVSDRFIVNGALAIAGNTTLTLSGAQMIVPGTTLDLISASGGVSGSFANVILSGAMSGQVRQQGSNIRFLALFPAATGLGVAADKSATYLNELLASNRASAALVAAMPALLDASGSSDARQLARVRPEAYASAGQIGVENGLAVAETVRDGVTASSRMHKGWFGFAQGLGNWRDLPGDASLGTTRANISQFGALGGIGFGMENAMIAAYLGNVHAQQNNAYLGARSRSTGLLLGLAGQVALGGARLGASISYDDSNIDTKRTLPGAALASGSGDTESWTFDVTASYPLALGRQWALEPRLGYTYVRSVRERVQESGSAAFALTVDGRRTRASFVDMAVTLRGGRAADSRLRPWLSFGWRHQASGRDAYADAAFANTDVRFSARGVTRAEHMVTTGAGMEFAADKRASLFVSWHAEFEDRAAHQVNAGVRIVL